MTGVPAYLTQEQRVRLQPVVTFLASSLEDQRTVDWALKLTPQQEVERIAVEMALGRFGGGELSSPWREAWRLIEESWRHRRTEDPQQLAPYEAASRLRKGERTLSVARLIAGSVAPRIKLKTISSGTLGLQRPSRKPKRTDDIFFASLTSNRLVRARDYGILKIEEADFLRELFLLLQEAVNSGLQSASNIGWDGWQALWRLGSLNRVYFVCQDENEDLSNDPDWVHEGIAPSVKLLFEVAKRLSVLGDRTIQSDVRAWLSRGDIVSQRLGVAAGYHTKFVDADEVGRVILDAQDEFFWDEHRAPEFFEARARLFSSFSPEWKNGICNRLIKRPPKSFVRKSFTKDRAEEFRTLIAAREFKRIVNAGGRLPESARIWLAKNEAIVADFTEVDIRSSVVTSAWESGPSGEEFDQYDGEERLRSLERALAAKSQQWKSDRASGARSWLHSGENAQWAFLELVKSRRSPREFPNLWCALGTAHRPPNNPDAAFPDPNLNDALRATLNLFAAESDEVLAKNIAPYSEWLSNWSNYLPAEQPVWSLWRKFWPLAVEDTNKKEQENETIELSAALGEDPADNEPQDLDVLNSAVGNLVRVFLRLCPNLENEPNPFLGDNPLTGLRNRIVATTGQAEVIGLHRLIQSASYFLRADPDWTDTALIRNLQSEGEKRASLWRAISRTTPSPALMKLIGRDMAREAANREVSREVRKRLVFRVIIDALSSLERAEQSGASRAEIQQMLRRLEPELRGHAAHAIELFVSQNAANDDAKAAELFNTAAKPFLDRVWPSERSLSSPSVSRALSSLPAASGGAFVDAYHAVERFLVPFECWAMHDFGLASASGDEVGNSRVLRNVEEARVTLEMLDRTIGRDEGSVVPYDLSSFLDLIASIDGMLGHEPAFRRLAALARQ